MKDKSKKMRAAIIGVIQFLQQQENESTEISLSTWSRSGRETIMQNSIAVQSRAFGLRWQRK
jgi:hypothetical protein